MAKAPTIKFPRISAGFYHVTFDGESVGYIMKEVDDDSKETNWYIFDDSDPNKDVAMLNPDNAIDTPDSLLREAKESAKKYFMNRPVKVEVAVESPVMNEAEWSESEEDEVEPSDEDMIEDHTLFVSDDGDFEMFEDELELIENDLEYDSVEDESLALV